MAWVILGNLTDRVRRAPPWPGQICYATPTWGPEGQMIGCRRPISETIMFCMEINALLLFKRDLLHRDFDVFNFSHMSDLLADEVSNVVLLKLYTLKFEQLSADVVVF